MKRIEEIDKRFAIYTTIEKENTVRHNVLDAPFELCGLLKPDETDDKFHRLPEDVAKAVNEGVHGLYAHCAGGRVRFRTNSSYMAIEATLGDVVGRMPHFALSGSAGFDLYSGKKHITTFQPMFDVVDRVFAAIHIQQSETRDYEINFPLYSEVKELYIYLDRDAVIEAPTKYSQEKPIVYYGSSITQGGCASHSGVSFPAIISRELNLDFINLGFSGSAMGEDAIRDYVAKLPMSAMVLDYDHNSPSAAHLQETHEPFFKAVREAHPDIPIICVTQPIPCVRDFVERKEIILRTVENARASGDKNAYYLDMSDYLNQKGVLDLCSVDLCHPNDLGFYFMAEAIREKLEIAFGNL